MATTRTCHTSFWIAQAPDPRPLPIRWHGTPRPVHTTPPLPLAPDDRPVLADAAEEVADAALQAHARTLVHAVVDTLQGRRPLAQLTRWVTADVTAALALRMRLQGTPGHLAVRSIHVQLVSPTVAEVAVRLQAHQRFTAAAFRLERTDTRWICPVADFGPLPNAGQRRL